MTIVERLRGTSTADVSAWMALTNEAADEIDRLNRLVERTRWRPIETAPTDETPVLLYLPGNREARRVLACSSDGTQWWALSGSVILGTPTHWMPLPSFTSDKS